MQPSGESSAHWITVFAPSLKWASGKPITEQPYFSEQTAYLKELQTARHLTDVGEMVDRDMVVVRWSSQDERRILAWANNSPWVRNGVAMAKTAWDEGLHA